MTTRGPSARTCWPGFCDLYADRVLPVVGGVVRAGADARARSPSSSAADPGTIRRSVASWDRVSPTAPWSATSSHRRPPRRRTRWDGPPPTVPECCSAPGNYAGDVMNFTLAQQRLCDEGIDTRVVFVTDDMASAPVEEIDKRRGIAGDFVVFKIARRRRRSRLRPRRGRTRRPTGQRPHPDPGRGFRGLHHARRGHPAVHRARTVRWASASASTASPAIAEADLPRAADLARRLVDGVLAEAPGDDQPRRRGDPQRARRHQVRGAVRGVAHRRTDCCAMPATRWSTPRSASWSPASTWRAAR